MSASPAAAKYQELRQKIAEARRTMEETAKGLFNEMSAELFAGNPDLIGFGWRQYTPYFNDGDVCTFRARTDDPSVTMVIDGKNVVWDSCSWDLTTEDDEMVQTAEYYRDEVFEKMPKIARVSPIIVEGKSVAYDWATKAVTIDGVPAKTKEEYRKIFGDLETKVGEFLGTFEDDDLQTMFGDHITVSVKRDGVTTDEYSHD